MSDEQRANIRKAEAETDAVLVEMGAVTNDEVRSRLAGEEDSPYAGLDLSVPLGPPMEDPGHDPGMKHFREFESGESEEAEAETA